MAEQALTNREDIGLKPLHQLAARGRITGQTAADKGGVGGHVGPLKGVYQGGRGRVSDGFCQKGSSCSHSRHFD